MEYDSLPPSKVRIFKTIFLLSRLLGLLPHNNRLQRSNRWMTFSALFSTFAIICNILLHWLYLVFRRWKNDEWFKHPLHICTFIVRAILTNSLFSSHLAQIVLKRQDLDTMFLHIRNVTVSKKLSPQFLGPITIFGCFNSLLLNFIWQCCISDDLIDWAKGVSSMLTSLFSLLITMQFCAAVAVVRNGFFTVNASLRRKRNFDYCVCEHGRLISRAKCINKFYSKQLLFSVTLSVDNIITLIFYAYETYRLDIHVCADVLLLLVAQELFVLLCLCRSCETTKKAADTFSSELFRIMRESKNLCNNEKLNLYVSMKQTVNFTACGFFSLGYPLVTSIIAAATTYLVILVQFSLSSST